MRFTTLLTSNRNWPLLVVAVTVFSLLIAFAPTLQAAPASAPVQPSLAQQQIFNDDLTVRNGESIDGDVVVYQGDVVVARGGAIRGNLVVYRGNVEVDEGGLVAGDITAFSGDVEIDGAVNGSITAWSGDVNLGRSAVVGGDVSVVSGEIEQDRGAVIEGSLLRGPAVNPLPALPQIGALSGAPVAPMAPITPMPTPIEMFWVLLGRVFNALLILAVAVLVAILLLKWRPALVEDMRGLLVERTALAFAAGLIFNLFGLALIGLLWITFCFRPPAVLLGLLLVAVNLVGLTIVGDELGRRFATRLDAPWPQPWRTAIGIVAPGAVIAFLWILGSCFGFLAFLGALILSAFGVGAILVKVLKLGEPQAPTPATPPAPIVSEAPAETDAAAPAEVAPTAPAGDAVPEAAADAATTPISPTPATQAAPGEDDFTRINGIGPVFDQRLKEAGVRTFVELAALTSAEIAEIVKWSVARVERAAIIEQARQLA
jgi:predicted flap endonuclease-1-like 5' DNA nuclease/cytoskeletal protein CcmA (bactofilin family)